LSFSEAVCTECQKSPALMPRSGAVSMMIVQVAGRLGVAGGIGCLRRSVFLDDRPLPALPVSQLFDRNCRAHSGVRDRSRLVSGISGPLRVG
jgi:hypothetical protein